MAKRTFTANYNHPLNEAQQVAYLAGNTYDIDADVEAAAAKAGALAPAKAEPAKADK